MMDEQISTSLTGYGRTATSYQFACEPLSPALEEASDLLQEHYEELATYKGDIPLDPDYNAYRKAAKFDMLRVFTARVEGRLVGYAVFFVRPHHHYKSTKWAQMDIVLIDKQYRNAGLGSGLVTCIENTLKREGVHVIHWTTKVEHPVLGLLLESFGYKHVEQGYSKRL